MSISSAQTFGDLLRRYRRAARLTQEELAERAGLSVKGVGDLERGAKLRPRRDTIRLLAEALNLSDQHLAALTAALRNAAVENPPDSATVNQPTLPQQAAPLSATTHNLPAQTTSFVGRAAEMEQLRGLLLRRGRRLVTLTGPGGSGKTRLAQETAATLLADFTDGVYFVNLAALADPELVVAAITRTLGLQEGAGPSPLDTLKDYLKDKLLLLLLDNFEHLLGAATKVSELLAAAPRLQVLATSRTLLRLRGEQEFAVPPLALPAPAEFDNGVGLRANEAVLLFTDRAAHAHLAFELTEQNERVVAEIVRRLDGLPLAIELAAARVKLMSPQALLTRLGSRLELLKSGRVDLPGRQQTLRAAIEWSYDLLNEAEQTLFRRLAVFSGGRSLEAIEAVCAADEQDQIDVLETLGSLVDKSLLYMEQVGGEARFIMLETIHEYARERLAASGEGPDYHSRHLDYFLALAETAEIQLRGVNQLNCLALLEAELDNIRAALSWALTHAQGAKALRLVAALWQFWWVHSHFREGRRWMEDALHQQDAGAKLARLDKLAFAKAINAQAGLLIYLLGDLTAAQQLLGSALTLFQELSDDSWVAEVLTNIGVLMLEYQDLPAARRSFEQSLNLWQLTPDKWGMTRTIHNLSVAMLIEGDVAQARRLAEESLVMARAGGAPILISRTTWFLGVIHRVQGDYPQAARLLREALAVAWEGGDRESAAESMNEYARVLAAQGWLSRAVMLSAAAEGIRQRIGRVLGRSDSTELDHDRAAAREQLGDREFEQAWHQGRALSSSAAIALALGELDGD